MKKMHNEKIYQYQKLWNLMVGKQYVKKCEIEKEKYVHKRKKKTFLEIRIFLV